VLPEIAQLLETAAGARGFLVVFLSGDTPWTDQPMPALITLLAQAPDPVPELLVKNLVMSTAMVLTHQDRHDPVAAAGSQQVADRSAQLLAQLPHCQSLMAQMYASLTTDIGPYQDFLARWNYSPAQKGAMAQVLANLLFTE